MTIEGALAASQSRHAPLPCRVLKLGGSLLTDPQWPKAFLKWRSSRPEAHDVVLAGGGPWCDALRQVDASFQLGEEFCHDRCLELMSVTSQLAMRALRRYTESIQYLRSRQEARAALTAAVPAQLLVLDLGRALLAEGSLWEPSLLPHTWEVTSDSLSAIAAHRLHANELVLFKSCPSPVPATFGRAAADGLVDAYFPTAAKLVTHVQWVQLNSPHPTTVRLSH